MVCLHTYIHTRIHTCIHTHTHTHTYKDACVRASVRAYVYVGYSWSCTPVKDILAAMSICCFVLARQPGYEKGLVFQDTWCMQTPVTQNTTNAGLIRAKLIWRHRQTCKYAYMYICCNYMHMYICIDIRMYDACIGMYVCMYVCTHVCM